MNKVFLQGRITKDLTLQTTNSQKSYLKFSVAVNRRKKDESDFFNCIAWEKQAEFINNWFGKGAQITIVGRLLTGSYESNEKKVYTTEVAIEEIFFCGKYEKGSPGQQNQQQNQYAGAPDENEELPF